MKGLLKSTFLYCRRFRRRTEGMAAVEFALLGTVLLLFMGGIIDLGHGWYLRQVITNASREGARYGVAFQVDATATRIKPNALSPSISNYVTNNYLTSTELPTDANPIVSVAGVGYTSGVKGDPVEVTVTITKKWWMVSSLVPGMSQSINLSATTVMRCE